MNKPLRILIVRLSSIGDIILTTAMVRCVRAKFPDAEISFLIKKQFSDLVMHNPNIHQVISFDSKSGFKGLLKLRRQVVNEQFDWMIDIHNNLRSNVLKLNSGIPLITRYHKRILHRTLLIKFKKNRYKNHVPVMLRYFEAVEKQGVVYDNRGTEIFYTAAEAEKVNDLLFREKIDTERLAVVCPGASYTNKQWNLEGFCNVVKHLHQQKNMQVVLLGGGGDVEFCKAILRETGLKLPNFAGKLKLLESAALLRLSKLTITNDSGMMHMAQSQKSKVLAIFGPTTRELGYFPMKSNAAVAEVELDCRPCTHKGSNHCPKKHHNCMNLIEAARVAELADELLQTKINE